MHPSVFTELLINLLKFLPFHWKLKLTSIRAIKNRVQRRHVIFVGFGYKKSSGSSFFGAWADFHWNYERSFPNLRACELKISKFGGLRAKIWAKIEAVEAKIVKFSQKGALWTDTFAWNGTLVNCRRGVKRGSSGLHIPIPPF